ncbi:TIGR03668 family PPOX class F420-dependent oxidoreductase [Streptomyces physcomitrii]|uniref:TIGR03668 family PPOX class F420-dependent oxidoreductase n=1 Tax=Streptomyces physcomitrii TaxID=2724184 RepID=A0ABX1H2W5_9ACTN|nr:TIGR03668 family PPOX class F420-dependent oxidoreductase [Streptomyces physcomitrii]NKI42699.1 TIGR03668 family PPOX class F420-dependent oxidoreductase [Streptomyces physcomitrii]
MRLPEAEAARRLAAARVLRLGTVDAEGAPHLVPATFALHETTVVIAVDAKPKRHTRLRRLANIRQNPQVCVLVDEYDDDWERLWWVRGDGTASILEGADREGPLDWLAAKYPQYVGERPLGPVIRIELTRLTGWAFAGS